MQHVTRGRSKEDIIEIHYIEEADSIESAEFVETSSVIS